MAEPPLVGEEFAGYRLVSVLGRGGMSIVFRAENPRLGNVIALKVLDPALANDDTFRTRFLEESRIAASMNHPNVIPIHDMGSSAGLLYIAMRYVTGTDLRQILKKRGRLPTERSVVLLEQAARALDAAHRRGLVHRDVKPGNLLVEQANEGADPDHVYLADFGITKHLGAQTGLTSSDAFLGTIDYIAPEQIRGISVLGLADQYSLGCVLYECLTGRVPFEKDLDAAIIWAHVEEPPTLPTVHRPDLPPAVDRVFARVLAKHPGDRYETCREFMTAAREALGRMAEPPAPGALRMFLPLSGPVPYPAGPSPLPGFPPVLPDPASPTVADLADYPAELTHEASDEPSGPAAQWPPAESAPPSPPPGQPVPPLPPAPGRHLGRHRDRRRTWQIAAAALILIVGTVTGVTLSLTGGHGAPQAGGATTPATGASMKTSTTMPSPKTNASMSSMAATTPAAESARTTSCAPDGTVADRAGNKGQSGPATLTGVLQQADLCSTPAGILPTSSCKAHSATIVTCAKPVAGVAAVTFQTYASTTDLYNAYQAQITQLNGSYRANTKTRCGNAIATYSETGWNHLEAHPTQYTVPQMESGSFNQVDAMGRQACFTTHGESYLVWTTDVGNMLAVAQGGTMSTLYNWWANIHHVIIFPGTDMCGQSMGRMASVPQGNLISAPVCPSGATPDTGAGMAGGM
ncbi:MAG TPA: protein kinase [Trebonia sp.]